MIENKIVEHLNDLLQMEFDANRAYELCIMNIDDKDLRLKLNAFHGDHQRHLHKITEIIIRHDGKPKSRPDLKGPFIAGMTAVMSMTGTKNALRVMIQNEVLTNRAYDSAVEFHQFPEDVQKVLQAFRSDERRHKAWLESRLAELGAEETLGEQEPGRGEAKP